MISRNERIRIRRQMRRRIRDVVAERRRARALTATEPAADPTARPALDAPAVRSG